MTQYYNDFSQYVTGSAPSDFSLRWAATAGYLSVIEDAGASGGKYLSIDKSSDGAASAFLASWDAIDSDPSRDNIEIFAKYRASAITNDAGGIAARGSSPQTGYLFYLSNDLARIAKYDSSSFSLISEGTITTLANQWYFLRAKAQGTSLKIRVWTGVIDDEPATWNIEVSESSISTAGWAGLFAFRNIVHDYDIFSVGTGGDPAPTEPVSGSTATITDIDGDESVYPGQSYIIQATDDIGATQGTVFWERLDGTDDVQHTVTSWDAATDQITVTAVRGGHNYGSGLYRARVVLGDGTTEILFDNAVAGLTLEAQPGTFAVTAASPNTTDPASLWSGLVDTATGDPVTVVDGDQAWVKDPNNLGNLSITPAGAISADTTGDFVVQFWKASEGVWGSDQTVSFTLPAEPSAPNIDLKKKQNKRRRYTANLLGAWRNRFIGEDDE